MRAGSKLLFDLLLMAELFEVQLKFCLVGRGASVRCSDSCRQLSCVLFLLLLLLLLLCLYPGSVPTRVQACPPLSSKVLRERFSLLGAYAGCLCRVLSPTLVTSGDSKRADPQVVA